MGGNLLAGLIKGVAVAAVVVSTSSLFLVKDAMALTTLPFQVFENSGSGLVAKLEVMADGTNAWFKFINDSSLSGTASNSIIEDIYFENGLTSVGLSNAALGTASRSVKFSPARVSGNPPGKNHIPNNPWAGTMARFDADSPAPKKGIGPGEYLNIHFDYSGTEEALVTALTDLNGYSRIAMHVLDCVGYKSCTASVVPIPAAIWMFGSALLGLVVVTRRRSSRGIDGLSA